jgi:serine/threonine-protein kinase
MVSESFPAEAGDPPAGFAEGSRLADYHLEDRIGAGGMAVVFRARDERLQRQVALKVLAPSLAGDEAFRQRFIRESQAAAAVDDPHIIPVFEAGEADGVLFLAMRYVPGGDVRALVRRVGPCSPAQALAIISPVASALDAAHSAGLVHRDVKLANILLDVRPGRPDHVYLSDFGLSKMVLSSLGPTRVGQFLGTPGYSAPEQLEGKPVDGRADQYSLACATFELLCGQTPFPRDQIAAVIWAHISEPPPPLTSRRPGLPQAVDRVMAKALAKSPADRYASCQEFAGALREALGLASYDGSAVMSPPDRPPSGIALPDGPPTAERSTPAALRRQAIKESGATEKASALGRYQTRLQRRMPAASSGPPTWQRSRLDAALVAPGTGGTYAMKMYTGSRTSSARKHRMPLILVGVLLIAAVGVAIGLISNANSSVVSTANSLINSPCQNVVVPAYFHPGDGWIRATDSNPVPRIMILDVSGSGAGNAPERKYQTAVKQAQAAGITVMGYSDTNYTQRSPAAIEADVRNYKAWYSVTDIFLDQVSSGSGQLGYYRNLSRYIHGVNPGSAVMLNPGTYPDQGYMSVGDILLVFENTYASYLSLQVPTWVHRYPATRFAHVIYATSA